MSFPMLLMVLLLETLRSTSLANALLLPLHPPWNSNIDSSPSPNSTAARQASSSPRSCPISIPWHACRRVSHARFKFLHKVEEEIHLVYTDPKLSLFQDEKYVFSFYTIPALRQVSIKGLDSKWPGPENITQGFDRGEGTLLFEPPVRGTIKIELQLESSSTWWIKGELNIFKLGP